MRNHDPLAVGRFDREHGPAAGTKRRMASTCGSLDVVRAVLDSTHDQLVLQAVRHEQLAVTHETEVTGSEKGPLARRDEPCTERIGRFLRPVPVSTRHAPTMDPELTDLVGPTAATAVGIDHGHQLISQRSAAAHKGTPGSFPDCDDPPALEARGHD